MWHILSAFHKSLLGQETSVTPYNPGSLDSLSQLSTPGPIQPIEVSHGSHKRLMHTSNTCIIICNKQEATILSLPLQTSKAIPADRDASTNPT